MVTTTIRYRCGHAVPFETRLCPSPRLVHELHTMLCPACTPGDDPDFSRDDDQARLDRTNPERRVQFVRPL